VTKLRKVGIQQEPTFFVSLQMTLCHLNAKHLPEPVIPGDGQEFWGVEFAGGEFY
jgi:hypothetical protein